MNPVIRWISVNCAAVVLILAMSLSTASGARWWKGNLHTHTYWSDGDDYPEMVAAWYQSHGYNFLAFSDHNSVQAGTKWVTINTPGHETALQKYMARFGSNWVESATTPSTNAAQGATLKVRLKSFDEFHGQFDQKGKFLLIRSEEISDRYEHKPLHVGAVNLREVIPPPGGTSVVHVLQNAVDAVLEQGRRWGQPTLAHINHPNFRWAITGEELMQVQRTRFFEVYNGHPHVDNAGDAIHAGTERMWDLMLANKLAGPGGDLMFAVATDDAHNYHRFGPGSSNPGRGWIMVRAKSLTAPDVIQALNAGDFYASTGVRLRDVKHDARKYSVKVDAERGTRYTIQFIGTRRGHDARSEPVLDESGKPLPVTRRYSAEIGQVLFEEEGTSATYRFTGDELYVRAKIISSKTRTDAVTGERRSSKKKKSAIPARPDEPFASEAAWTQPVQVGN